jgi:hypothetical protein
MKTAETAGKKMKIRKNWRVRICSLVPTIPATMDVKIRKKTAPRITAVM